MKIDLHCMELIEAKEELALRIEEYQTLGVREIIIIHGYQHGQVLKNYIRSERFLEEMRKEGLKLKRNRFENPGETVFYLL